MKATTIIQLFGILAIAGGSYWLFSPYQQCVRDTSMARAFSHYARVGEVVSGIPYETGLKYEISFHCKKVTKW